MAKFSVGLVASGFLAFSWGVLAVEIEAPSEQQIRGYWGAGAEVTSYALSQSRYGETHQGHAELIFAREPFLPEAQVKRDFGAEKSVPVLKLNALRTFNTGLYSYRTMQSTFSPFDRERFPRSLKTTLSVQDWCGQVFHQLNWRDEGWRSRSFSYFQSEGDEEVSLEGAWLEDDLWIALRQDPSALPVGEFRVIPALLFGRFAHEDLAVVEAVGSIEKRGDRAVYLVDYVELDRRLEIEFEPRFPFYIQSWRESGRGGVTTAKRVGGMGQVEYWRLNKPENAELRETLGLEEEPD